MSDEYPKALYKGDKKNYEMLISNDHEQEAEQRENGYVHFQELPDYVETSAKVRESADSSDVQDLKKELLEALKAIEEKDAIILDQQETYIAETNELRKKVRLLELSNLGANDLQKILEEKQVKYGARDSKDELVKLVFDAEYPVDTEEE